MESPRLLALALTAADPQACASLLARAPELARRAAKHGSESAHPLMLLAQWQGRWPQRGDDAGLRGRVLACAQSLFAAGSDLSAPATALGKDTCASALLSQMAHHRDLDRAWGVRQSACPHTLIMQASLSDASPRREAAARAWLRAATRMAREPLPEAEAGGFKHFMALASSLAEREALLADCPPSIAPRHGQSRL